MIENVVFGAVYHDGVLTVSMRTGARISFEKQQRRVPLSAAAVLVLETCARHRHDLPMLYLAGDGAGELQTAIQNATSDAPTALPSAVIEWFADSANPKYKNRGAELVDTFAIRPGKYMPPHNAPGLGTELAAFRREEINGVLVYPSPETVAVELDRFPSLALALLLAVQPARELAMIQHYGHAPLGGYSHNPHASPDGHNPMNGGGHNPW